MWGGRTDDQTVSLQGLKILNVRHIDSTHSTQQRSTLIHPIVTLLPPLLKNQLPSLFLQPLLAPRQIQEVSVRPLHIRNFDFLRFPLLGNHVRSRDEVQRVSKVRFPRDGGEGLERLVAQLSVLLLSPISV